MQWLSDNGYTTVFLSQLSDYEETGAPLPEKPVVVTLDDGYENNLTLVLPILEKLDLRATVSVVGSFSLDTADTRCHLDLADVKTLADSGRVEIGSHTYAMAAGENLPPGDLRGDVQSGVVPYRGLSADPQDPRRDGLYRHPGGLCQP